MLASYVRIIFTNKDHWKLFFAMGITISILSITYYVLMVIIANKTSESLGAGFETFDIRAQWMILVGAICMLALSIFVITFPAHPKKILVENTDD